MNSKQKGKRGELELVNALKKLGFHDVRRSQQFNGLSGEADLIGLDKIHIECKRVERLNIYEAIEQATRDCESDIPCVFHRKNNFEWQVTMPLEIWVEFYKKWIE